MIMEISGDIYFDIIDERVKIIDKETEIID